MSSGFGDSGLEITEHVAAALKKAGIREASEIQRAAAAPILAGKDVLIQSATGTGKTLAYLLPLLQRMRGDEAFRLLVLAPSPELAIQILRVAEAFAGPGITGASLVGGANPDRQRERLKKHPRVIVGTPGRVIEMIFDRRLKVAQMSAVVLDETDEILSPANEKNLREIASRPEFKPQLVFTSATFAPRAEQLAKDLMREGYVRLAPATQPLPSKVEHYFTTFDERRKEVWLARLLDKHRIKRALVFVNKLETVGHLYRFLNESGVRAVTVSSERKKRGREQAIRDFKKGDARVLIATDTAARGLDVPGLDWVVHYDVARDKDIYVHRIGRTGRAGRSGTSVMMVAKQEMFLLGRYNDELGVELRPL
ncbi:MAG TPA: DEAD/DEAH box helicase [Myxococcota bacterium]|nr:DEAD/DEAH box helicase [Myxococcota bacterium]